MKERIRERTTSVINDALTHEGPVLIEAPPASGKTYNAVRIASQANTQVTYFAARRDLYKQAEQEAKQFGGISFETVPSPHRDCPTFKGENDGEETKAKRLYNSGRTGREIHYTDEARTPCQNSTDKTCQYVTKLERVESEAARNELDLLIGNHQHAYKTEYLKDRTVIFDEFNPEPFVTAFPSETDNRDAPSEILAEVVQEIDAIPCDDITDLLEARATCSDAYQETMEWLRDVGTDKQATLEHLELNSYRYNRAHESAFQLAFSLLSMEKLGPGIEFTTTTEATNPDENEVTIRCVRDRNSNKMLLLQPPGGLQTASQIIGLDALPIQRLWETVFDCSFTVEQVVSRDNLKQYLTEELDIELIQLANGKNPYSGGRTSTNDGYRFVAAHLREGERFPTISTKQALESYDGRNWYHGCVRPAEDATAEDEELLGKNYATVRSSNEFANESLGMISGSPLPGDEVIKHWTGLCGEATEPKRSNGTLVGYDGFGQKVYEYFTHQQVFQAILRFGREVSETTTTVYLNTTALPTWLSEITYRIQIKTPDQNAKTIDVLEELISLQRSEDCISWQSVPSLRESLDQSAAGGSPRSDRYSDSISEPHIRQTLSRNDLSDYIEVRPDAGRGGADLYKWDQTASLMPCPYISSQSALLTESTVYFLHIPP